MSQLRLLVGRQLLEKRLILLIGEQLIQLSRDFGLVEILEYLLGGLLHEVSVDHILVEYVLRVSLGLNVHVGILSILLALQLLHLTRAKHYPHQVLQRFILLHIVLGDFWRLHDILQIIFEQVLRILALLSRVYAEVSVIGRESS